MTGTAVGIWVIVAVAVVGVAAWLVTVALAARRTGQAHPQQDQVRGVVQGGQHVGGGRSVAPTRDAPVPEAGGDPPTPEEQQEATNAGRQEQQEAADAGRRPPGSGSPMGL